MTTPRDGRASATLWLSVMAASVLGLVCLGCATVASVTPVQRPPAQYTKNATIVIETVSPETVAVRCFERGLLVPAIACGNPDLVTIANPCTKANPNQTDQLLCHEFARSQGWR